VGGGFGGLYAARALASRPVRVTLLDRRNHHLFQPLFYQVALTRTLGVPLDRADRVLVEPDLSIPSHPEAFAIGDSASSRTRPVRRCPDWRQSPSIRAARRRTT
jgi:NADH dehydrogenase FAD-containing subunit